MYIAEQSSLQSAIDKNVLKSSLSVSTWHKNAGSISALITPQLCCLPRSLTRTDT